MHGILIYFTILFLFSLGMTQMTANSTNSIFLCDKYMMFIFVKLVHKPNLKLLWILCLNVLVQCKSVEREMSIATREGAVIVIMR